MEKEFIAPETSVEILNKRYESFRFGKVAEKNGQYLESLTYYKAYAEFMLGAPDERVAYKCISRIHRRLGNEKLALLADIKFIELTTEPNRPKLYKELGEGILVEYPNIGLNLLKRAYDLDPKVGVIKQIMRLDPSFEK